ncbi:MAG: hypothetical protein IJ061_03100 [Lachnospiraceae bacterium]|nr:hypothetical protein [Lachnospiraceae bacterium]
MDKVLFIIGVICLLGVPCLLSAGILKKLRHQPSAIWFQGMGMMAVFAVFAFVLSYMLGGFGGSSGEGPAQGGSSAAGTTQEAEQSPANIKPSSETSFTLLMYMIGSDLESIDGAASADLAEILEAGPYGNVRIALQTGGAEKWHREEIDAAKVQRFLIEDGKLQHVEDVGAAAEISMTDAATLGDFLRWGVEAAPADRYAVIFWDHGGGTIVGYGHDEYDPDNVLSLAKIHEAIGQAGTHFDFVGFDACLMGTLETARTFSEYADYLIASEEYEPSTGWFYSDWIRMLSNDPDIGTEILGKTIVDDYVSEKNAGPYDFCTLSLIRLQMIPEVCERLSVWFADEADRIKSEFRLQAADRSHVKSFGGGNYEQVDLVALLEMEGGEGPEEEQVLDALDEAIVYAAHNKAVDVANGLAVYYPYAYTEEYEEVSGRMLDVGFEDIYFDYYDDFVNRIIRGQIVRAEQEDPEDRIGTVRAAGRIGPAAKNGADRSDGSGAASGSAAAGTGKDTGDGSSSDREAVSGSEPDKSVDSGREELPRLQVEDLLIRNYREVYNIPEEQEDLITDIRFLQLNPTEDGYVFCGKQGSRLSSASRSFDLSGGHYLSVGGRLVSFQQVYDSEAEDFLDSDLFRLDTSSKEAFQKSLTDYIYQNDVRILAEEDSSAEREHGDQWVRYGYADAVLNGEHYVKVQISWDKDHPNGVVAGYREIPEESAGMDAQSLYMPGKGLRQLKEGDSLQFYFDHFDGNAKKDGIVFLEEPLVIQGTAPKVGRCLEPFGHMEPGNIAIFTEDRVFLGEGKNFLFTYRITDVYNNIYYKDAEDVWEETVRFDVNDNGEALWREYFSPEARDGRREQSGGRTETTASSVQSQPLPVPQQPEQVQPVTQAAEPLPTEAVQPEQPNGEAEAANTAETEAFPEGYVDQITDNGRTIIAGASAGSYTTPTGSSGGGGGSSGGGGGGNNETAAQPSETETAPPETAAPPETETPPETEAPTPQTPAQTFASFTFDQFVSTSESEPLVTIMLDILTALEGAGVLDTVPNSVTAELLAGIPEVNMPVPPYTTIAELLGNPGIMYSIGLESISRALSDLPESVLAQVPEEDMQTFVNDIQARLP